MPGAGLCGSCGGTGRAPELRGRWLAFHFGIAVDDNLAEIGQQSGCSIAALEECEQPRRLFDESGGGPARLKDRMIDDVFQERNVGLDAADAKLAQTPVHPLAGVPEFAAPRGHLHQKRIVVGADDRAAVGRSSVEPETEASGRAVGVDLAVIRNEVVLRVFSGHAALQRVPVQWHLLLRRQIDLSAVQRVALRDKDLAAYQVDASHHLGYGMLHLNAWIDLDEVPCSGFAVDEKLHRAGVVISGHA